MPSPDLPTVLIGGGAAAVEASGRMRDVVSTGARKMRWDLDPEVRSHSASTVRRFGEATRFGASPLVRVGGPVLTLVGSGLIFAENLERGQDWKEAAVRTGLRAAFGFGAGFVGALAGAAFGPAAIVAVPVFAIAGAAIGDEAGKAVGNLIFGDPHVRDRAGFRPLDGRDASIDGSAIVPEYIAPSLPAAS